MPISSSLYNWKIFPLLPNLCCCKHVSWAFLKLCAHVQKYHYHACLEVKLLDLIICIALIFLCITKFFSQVFSQFIFPWKNFLSCSTQQNIWSYFNFVNQVGMKYQNILCFSKNCNWCQLCVGYLHFSVMNSVFTNFPLFKLVDFLFLLNNL